MNHVKIRFSDNPEGTEYDLFKTMEEMLHLSQPRFAFSRQRWRPHIDIYETEKEVVIIAEIAGVQNSGIDLEIAPRTIKISGTRETVLPETIGRYCLAEIPSGYFERSISLPAPTDTATAETEYSQGLLKIRLAKSIPREASKINIKAVSNQ